ncbi:MULTISPECIES: putative entry exclusion protein TrbK-alt [unclassified Mesorhizobium]|uniref:putative entry exclusion protein TrbK-alt n=1 Tax=unclassified Mesorhizobium TaxID=325217 RepID=UPI000FDB8769|nr:MULTISPECIES: putative entry exclusion protein TrbK-alt [unclassified Mesorhizobium]RWE77604.1 MAG: conjugal transfer protein TrbK [Mesorhizobium sp.]TGQ09073.1 conjugal transfer protein TrbK [Mesorhizobium sp. M2E.F.Ca.ET.219.01.1.1]TGT69608.1 conjugal transfer protein TrbK [Mesorhizobium sp. M2E.F.Ca.ET.166.01.1.1]TGW01939.1 conjugal transfer protein TrbK [Mesorhizobium sp. M2E.F.Ca.ET.154.01.1.1]
MDGKALARIVSVVFVALAVTASALEMSHKADKPLGEGLHAPAASMPDPLRDGLRRCQAIGEAALRDDGCARLWAKQRDRFLGLDKLSASSTSGPAVSQSPDAALREVR